MNRRRAGFIVALTLPASLVLAAIAGLGWAAPPEPEIDLDALYREAESDAARTNYEQAAGHFEQFAKQAPEHVRAPEALQNAYLFRLGLGQRDAAKRDLVAYQHLYEPGQRDDPEKVAQIFWSQHDLFDSAKDQRKHALAYLANFEEEGGLDRALVAEAVIAQIDWRRSCPKPLLMDSCISIVREAMPSKPSAKPKRPERCGLPSQSIVTVHRRNLKQAAAAQERFEKIDKLAARGKNIDIPEGDRPRGERFKAAWAMAIVYQTDAQYEEFLALELPDDLDFYLGDDRDSGDPVRERAYHDEVIKRDTSAKQLSIFFERKAQLGHEAMNHYGEVKKTGSAEWALVAAARTASLYQLFADQLDRAKLPARVRSAGQVAAYCQYMAKYAQPIADQAIAAWMYCTERSTEFQYFSEFSRMCEAEVEARAPNYYPATHELFGEAVYAGSGMVSVGVQPEPRPDSEAED